METLSKGQLSCIKTLVGKLGVQDSDALVMGFSGMRTGRVSELTVTEAAMLIKHLKSTDPDEAAAQRMRRKMIGMAYEYNGLGNTASKQEKLAAVKQLEAWVRKYGHGGKNGKHKEFNAYTKDELPLLVGQMAKVYKEFLQKV